jgi:acyl-coenzyme A thioesterase PaaI-like protein
MATVSARLNFAPVGGAGRMVASAKRCLALDAVSLPLGVSLLTIEAGGAICCSGEAAVAVLGEGHGTAPHPLPRENRIEDVAPLSPQELTPEEQEVLARARKAEWMPGPQAFLERFWGILPQAGEGWAECVVYAGRHVANRVGDVQGGILLGLAAQTSVAALPRGWSLVDLSAQFVAAASGPWVLARAECIRRGRNIAFVDCRISDNAGRTTLKAQATLARSN